MIATNPARRVSALLVFAVAITSCTGRQHPQDQTRQYLNPPGLMSNGPAASSVVRVGQMVFITAQLSTNEHGEIVAKGDPEGQDRQIWRNIDIAMKAAGGTLQDIVATWTYITSPDYTPAVAKVRAELFPTNPPTTSRPIVVQQVSGLGPDALVSVQAIAIIPVR